MTARKLSMIAMTLTMLTACDMPNAGQNPAGLVSTDVFIERALDNYNVGQPQATINPRPSADLEEDDLTTDV